MKNHLIRSSKPALTMLGVLLLCVTAPAAEPVPLTKTETETLNRFSASYRMLFNAGVSFKKIGGFSPVGHFVPGAGDQPANPGPATGGIENRTYEDGYNWVDNNNNTYDGLPPATRYWGYDNASQVVDDRYIVMHSSSAPANVSSDDRCDNPQSGFELAYQRELGRKEKWSWGLEGAFGITWFNIDDGRTLAGDVNQVNDSFEVPADEEGFRFIPPAGHQGSNLAGPLLGSEPTRTTALMPGGAIITGKRSFDAHLYGIRFGPYVTFPLKENITFTLNGGLAVAYVDSDFSFYETVTISDVGTETHSGSGSHSDWLVGGYVGGTFALDLTRQKDWQLVVGAQYQNLGDYTHKEGGQKAVLDLKAAVFVTVGVNYSF